MPTPKRQLELFDTDRFTEDFVAYIDGRLPEGDWLGVPDVATAFDVCSNQVHAWIEERLIRGYDKGAKDRRYLVIWRASVLHFARSRAE